MNRMVILAGAGAAVALLTARSHGATQHYQCVLSSKSTLTQSSQLSAPLPGTWIGNYNATSNPTGTRTLPGLSGGSGNVAIPFTSTVNAQLTVPTTAPEGSFEFGFDATTGAFDINKLYMDALAGATGSISTSITVSFDHWHTVAPSSIYFGVSNLTVPVGTGQLTRADATQNGIAAGTAVSTGAGTWSFAVAVPIDLMTEGAILDQPFGGDPIPAVFALAGTITMQPGGIVITVDATVDDSQPVPGLGALVNQPLEMPTILPPGQTAHLLVSGTFGEGTASSQVDAHLVAPGDLIGVPGDFNGDGIVNGADLGALLGFWGAPGGDLDGDGTTNGADLGMLLGYWTV